MKNTKTIPIRRLFNGLASVRDYVLKKCYQEGKDIILTYKNEKMTVLHKELKSKSFQLSDKTFTSRYGSEPYRLIDYKFEADKETNQEALFE